MSKLNKHYKIAFWLTLTVAIGLFVGGFFCPPMGEISGSVLSAVGILFLWPALAFAAKALSEGKTATIRKGDTTIQLGKENKDLIDEINELQESGIQDM